MFSGETIYLVPENVIRPRIRIFKRRVEQNEGVWNESLDPNVTIVLLDDEVDKVLSDDLCSQIKDQAHAKPLRLSWLVDCLKQNTKLDTAPYAVEFPDSRKRGRGGSARTSKKKSSKEPSPARRRTARSSKKSTKEQSPPRKQPKDEETDFSENETSSAASGLEEERFLSGDDSAPKEEQRDAHPNQGIIDQLKILADGYRSISDRWRTYAYENATRAIEKYDHPISSSEELRSIPGVGKRIVEKIEDFWKSGSVKRAEEFQSDERLQALELFNSIWGVGPVKAEQWYAQGYRTLEDIREKAGLTHQQEVGLKYRDEFLKGIPRKEVAEIGRIVHDEVKSIDEEYVVEICGSYRREEPVSGDIDILITHPDGSSHRKILSLLVKRMSDKGFFTDSLTEQKRDVHKFMGVCRLPEKDSLHRRIDILAVPYNEFPTALLYNTGSALFVRSVNARAKHMGMRLNMHGLRENVKRERRQVVDHGRRVDIHSEEDVFRHLNMNYRAPKDRKSF